MLHHHTLILNVIVFKLVGVVEIDQEDFCHEVLNYLPVTLHWKDSFLCLALYLNEMDFILIIKDGGPTVT